VDVRRVEQPVGPPAARTNSRVSSKAWSWLRPFTMLLYFFWLPTVTLAVLHAMPNMLLTQGFHNRTSLWDRDNAPVMRHGLPNGLQTSSYGARKVLGTTEPLSAEPVAAQLQAILTRLTAVEQLQTIACHSTRC